MSRYRNIPKVEVPIYPSPVDTAINASVVAKYDDPPTADSVRAALDHWRADMYGHVGNEIPFPPAESECPPPVDANVIPITRRYPKLGYGGWFSTK